MATFEMVAKVADKVMFNLEDNEVYGKIAQVRNFEQGYEQILRWDFIG